MRSTPSKIGREQIWPIDRPGSRQPPAIPLLASASLGPDDVYVPGGWSPTGGDANGAGSLPARKLWIDGFVLRRFPVTWGEYVEFLNAVDDSESWQPRDTGGPDQAGAPLLTKDPEWSLGDRPADHPVTNIDWASAVAFADWRAEQDGVAWRLPCELEWEKAARGVDERFLP